MNKNTIKDTEPFLNNLIYKSNFLMC